MACLLVLLLEGFSHNMVHLAGQRLTALDGQVHDSLEMVQVQSRFHLYTTRGDALLCFINAKIPDIQLQHMRMIPYSPRVIDASISPGTRGRGWNADVCK